MRELNAPYPEDLERLDGPQLRRFFAGGLEALRRCSQAVDRLNVFPVPDGDTGGNMLATLAAALQAAERCPEAGLGTMAGELARGALMGARGNSGVILAQTLAGLAGACVGVAEAEARSWAAAWQEAARAAYRSVGTPVEGTVLTVVREAAEAAAKAADSGLPLLSAWRAMADAADAAVVCTARLLPVLERAEVVDAGGLGLALVLRGGLCAFTGDPLPDPGRLPAPSVRTRQVIQEASFPRYCTELVLTGARVERPELERRLLALGDSLDVTWGSEESGPEAPLHIHLHTDEPESLFAYAATLGTVSHRKVEDMEAQRSRYLAVSGNGPLETGIVAVASGAGFRRILENLYGMAGVVERRPGAPPDARELATALAHAPARSLLLLTDGPDLWPAAQEAAAASTRPARAVLTHNLPEAIAAALAFDESASLDENAGAMLEAARQVRTINVPRPEDRKLADAAEDKMAALGDGFALITLYYGAGASRVEAEDLAARLERRFPGVEIEVVEGGQPEWPLVIAAE